MNGKQTPRIYTASDEHHHTRGNDFKDFCDNILNFKLFPWQEWLTRNALATDENGNYLYKRVFVKMGRQNGKTKLATALVCWWLYKDIARERDKQHEANVMGFAQNLEIAEDVWDEVCILFDTEHPQSVPELAEMTEKIVRGNGRRALVLKNGFTYKARVGNHQRGKRVSRIIFDELLEQTDMETWSSVSGFTKTFTDGQIWTFTTGAKPESVAQKFLYDKALDDVNSNTPRWFLADWSPSTDCALDDVDAVLQANPSCGYIPAMTVESLMSEQKEQTESKYRREVLAIDEGVTSDTLFTKRTLEQLQYPAYNSKEVKRVVAVGFHTHDRAYSGVTAITELTDGTLVAGMLSELRAGTAYAETILDYIRYRENVLCLSSLPTTHGVNTLYDYLKSGELNILQGSTLLIEHLALTSGKIKNGDVTLKFDSGIFGALATAIAVILDDEKEQANSSVSIYEKQDILVLD